VSRGLNAAGACCWPLTHSSAAVMEEYRAIPLSTLWATPGL